MSAELFRICNRCGVSKEVGNFELIKDKKNARRRVCYSCRFQGERKTPSYLARQDAKSERLKSSRQDSANRAKFIRQDMGRYDRRHGHITNPISVDWIEEQICKPCSYCERCLDKSEMTLDRIDNSRGHTQDNLTPACSMCNYFRRDMPHEAWLLLAPAMKLVTNTNLLDGWNAGGRLRRTKISTHESIINQP